MFICYVICIFRESQEYIRSQEGNSASKRTFLGHLVLPQYMEYQIAIFNLFYTLHLKQKVKEMIVKLCVHFDL